ncbi:MAG: type III-B CRISPR module-associated protein Cmr5 [Blastocatellia bacterium]|nr:type III-B CRISPR module-associated protein Cmr5 [Blastocatellia bacterium]
MPTRNQKYASSAYGHVSQVATESKEKKDKYKTMADKLPVLIHTAGLAQALAFANAKNGAFLLEDLAKTLNTNSNKDDLLKQSREANLAEYMKLTKDVLDALSWYKRLSQSLLEEKDN